MNECSCSQCQMACSVKPGWFRPEQIDPLATALGLTRQQLFDRHLLVDWFWVEKDRRDIFVLAPAIVGRAPGQEYPGNPYGQCSWYQNGKCNVHLLGKPFECATYRHDIPEDEANDIHTMIAGEWDRPQHQRMIVDLLGREPKATLYIPGIPEDLSEMFEALLRPVTSAPEVLL